MAKKKYGVYGKMSFTSWWKHLRKYGKRIAWKSIRYNVNKEAKKEV